MIIIFGIRRIQSEDEDRSLNFSKKSNYYLAVETVEESNLFNEIIEIESFINFNTK